jgi:nitrile hydratase
LPAYLAERQGKIERLYGAFPMADARARGDMSAAPEPLYSVVFDGREVWGEGSAEALTIAADLWDAYLEADAR